MKYNIDNKLESGFFINILLKNYKLLIWVCAITIVLASIFSSPFFITPKYKAQMVMFPASSNSISKALLTDQVSMKQDVLQYGEDEQIDQMLQVLSSNKLRDRVIEKFNLLEHYGYSNSSYKYTKLNKSFSENIKFRRTEFMAVSVTVMDKDPIMAANIANEIGSLYDSVSIGMQKERAMQAYLIVEQTYLSLVNDISRMEDSLAILRSLGINDYETQAEAINNQLAIQIAAGQTKAIKALQEQLDILSKYGTQYVSIRDQLDYDKRQLSLIKVKYEEAKLDAEQELTQKFIISEAFPAERKSYPIRWLIVVISTLAVALMTVVVLVIAELFPSDLPAIKSRLINTSENKINDADVESPKLENKKKSQQSKMISNNTITKVIENKTENKTEDNMNNFSAKKLWDILWKRKFHILIITIIGIIVGVIFSSPKFITPKYKSFAVVYPSNITPYSEESSSEQLYQWFMSTDIKWQVIEKFDLYKHYEIEKGSPKSLALILNEYNANVKIEQNSYEAVTITVFDKDPQMACDITNAIIDFLNVKIRAVHKEKFQEVIDVYDVTYGWSLEKMDEITSQMGDIGVDNNLLYALFKALGVDTKKTGNTSNATGIDNIAPEYISYLMQLKSINVSMQSFWDRYNYAYSNLQKKDYTYTSIITTPYVADKKSTPIRWIFVLFAGAAAFLLSYVGFVIAENVPCKTEEQE